MLDLAASNTFIKGVVGWVDFNAPEAQGVIERLAENPVLVGLRPMIQDIPEADWMLRPELKGVFSALIAQNLTFDALTLPQHLPNLKELLVRYPQMRVVIDHGSKPRIRENKFGQWAKSMADISRNTGAFCKLSGLVTEASPDWSVEDLKPYVEHLLETFGPERLIWGSDWPVCTLASSYDRWCETSDILLADLTSTQRTDIFGGTATRAYNLRDCDDVTST